MQFLALSFKKSPARAPIQREPHSKATAALLIRASLSAVLVAAFALIPVRALAGTQVASIKTTAQVETDGALRVTEQRRYQLPEERSIIKWPLALMEAESKINISSVRFAKTTEDETQPKQWTMLVPTGFSSETAQFYQETDGITSRVQAQKQRMAALHEGAASATVVPDAPSFSLDANKAALYLFIPPTSGSVIVDVDYTTAHALRAFDDVAELYWDYVPADADAAVASVETTVQLPLPEGVEAVAGENVWAWGHGASGTVQVRADGTILYTVAELRAKQYAQAHILFPQKWLTNLSLKDRFLHTGTRLDNAKAEEAAWTDTWSAWLVNSLGVDVGFIGISFIAIVWAIALWWMNGREQKPQTGMASSSLAGAACVEHPDVCEQQCEEAFQRLCAYTAPEVGRVMRWNHASPRDFVACLMQMIAQGAILVEEEQDLSCLGKGYPHLRFKAAAQSKRIIHSPVQQELFRLLFEVWGEGYMSVSLSDIHAYATADRQRFREQIAHWQALVSEDVAKREFFCPKSLRVQKQLLIGGCILAAAWFIFGVIGGSLVRGLALFAASAVWFVLANYAKRLSAEGTLLQTEALSAQLWLSRCAQLGDLQRQQVPYAFILDIPANSLACHNDFAAFWLAPRAGKGGMRIIPLADKLALSLDTWS